MHDRALSTGICSLVAYVSPLLPKPVLIGVGPHTMHGMHQLLGFEYSLQQTSSLEVVFSSSSSSSRVPSRACTPPATSCWVLEQLLWHGVPKADVCQLGLLKLWQQSMCGV